MQTHNNNTFLNVHREPTLDIYKLFEFAESRG